jgi:predicted ATPase/Tfp pilus assembly protein PilF
MPVAGRTESELVLPASRFVGRADDLAALRRLLAEGRRLVTVWGPGGMGKTRLALELARAFAAAHPGDRVRLCDVQAARDLRAFCAAVARALGVAVAAGKKERGTVERIGAALAAEGPALVVVDNLEQVVEVAAPALAAWLAAAPEARFVVTSRERTRLAGEVSYELGPLGLGDGASEAATLFLDRANARSPARPLGPESLDAIAPIVRALEGIPLAIELAAARVELLGLAGLGARLGRRLDLLGGTERGASERQATLRSAIAWSWDLLDEPDRRALACFAALRGSFSLDAASAALDGPALDRLQSLRDKSLLRVAPATHDGPPRFALYEAVRELGEEALAERGEAEAVGARVAAHVLAAGEDAAAAFARTGSTGALDRIGDDLANLFAVAERALSRPSSPGAAREALRALLVLDAVLATRGPFGLHLDLLDRALAAADAARLDDPRLRALALAARGRARPMRGDDAAGLADLAAARALAEGAGALAEVASIAVDVGLVHHRRRDLAEARASYDAALAIHRRLGDRRAEARVLGNLGALLHDELRFDEAERRYLEALEVASAIGDHRVAGIATMNVALLEQERGALDEARRRYERAAAVLEAAGDQRLLGITLGNLGMLCHEDGRLDEARASHERAVALLREAGDRRSEALAEARLGAALGALDRRDDARAALARGERLLVHLGDALGAELVALARGFVDLALARAARRGGAASEAASHLADVRGRVERARAGAPSAAERSDDVRLFARLLDRDSAQLTEAAGAPELVLAPEARFVRPPGAEWQDLRERTAARRLLLFLVDRHEKAPGRGASLDDLARAGWPGERILPRAASNRIYVAMNQLRKLGLRDFLAKDADGYFLAPALMVRRASDGPA